jgi:hypothetical protein
MPLKVQLTLRDGQAPPFRLCSEALASSDPPLAAASKADIARIRGNRIETLQGGDRFEAGEVFDALDQLPPIEGPRVGRLLMLLADSDFSWTDLKSALEELVRVSEGAHPFSRANDSGFISTTARAKNSRTGESMPPGEINLNAKRAEEAGVKALSRMYLHLAAVEVPETRREIIDDCRQIIALRLHFDFSQQQEG